MLEKLWYYIQGYLIIELCGECKERFVNLCKNREIELIDIYTINKSWYCKLRCKDFKKLKQFVRKTGCISNIKEKRGFPFLVRKMRDRKGFLIGSILFLILVIQCSSRIWHISVDGGFIHTREQMMQVMKQELGIYGGILKDQVDCFEVEKKLRLDYNEIGWISVEKRGCRLLVRLNESTMPAQIEVSEEPVHIVAAQDGIVRRLEVMSGIPQVKAGDSVKKGDILISGIIPVVGDFDELIRMEPVAAEGKVYLECEFSYQAKHPMVYEKKIIQKERSGLEIFFYKTKLFSYIPRYSDGKYDIISINVVPFVFDAYQTPILFRKHRIMQYETELVKLTETEIKTKADDAWNSFLKDWEAQGVQIVKAGYSMEIRQKNCCVTGLVTACGNFISYQEILEEEWKIDEHSGNNP